MKQHLLIAVLIAPIVSLSLAAEAGDELAPALKKAGSWENYAFTIEEKPGPGTAGALEGRYQKGKPLSCKADKIEFFKQDKAIVYRDGERWQRSKTGTVSDPLRVLGAVAKVYAVRLPHEEVGRVGKDLGPLKKAKDGEQTVYTAELGAEKARSLARTEHQGVAKSGTARFWVNGDGKLTKYTLTLKLQGRIGGAEIDGEVVKTVTLSGAGSTEVTIPEAARKALE